MLRRVKLMNPFEIVQDLVTQDRIAPDGRNLSRSS